MSVRRQLKNVVKNFSNSEVKVREATSNDPWGPSSSLMSEIADATYNVVAFSEIMGMLWKRLNDHGKNWRHVYKALVVLDYIIKTGSERVAQQCRENIFAIQTLKDFQFIDKDGKDQGMNVREKAKQLVALLKDEERLKSERQRALKAKERFAQASSGIGSESLKSGRITLRTSGSSSDIRAETSNNTDTNPTSRSWEPERKVIGSDIETCRPSNSNEEELQLQLALALSKQEADDNEKMKENEEKRVQIAISQSRGNATVLQQPATLLSMQSASGPQMAEPASGTFDPWGGSAGSNQSGNPWGASAAAPAATSSWQPQATAPAVDPWGVSQATSSQPTVAVTAVSAPPAADPWGGGGAPSQPVVAPSADPWGATPVAQPPAVQPSSDPWGIPPSSQNQDMWGSTPQQNAPFGTSPTGTTTFNGSMVPVSQPPPQNQDPFGSGEAMPQKAKPKGMLLQDPTLSSLVDLDNLATKPVPGTSPENPFISSTQPQINKSTNPFLADKPAAPSLNQLRGGTVPVTGFPQATAGGDVLLPAPLLPDSTTRTQPAGQNNPFL